MTPDRLGAYKVLDRIGRGGMGEVFSAVRVDGQYEKHVAIKVVRSGADLDSIRDRFRHERQILAGLDHPNIARLLDGGTTDEGLPYLVMELVQGVPVDEYCDAHALNIAARLRLFRQICKAVQDAHQRLVIHRDLKPPNILVTPDGVPKLLDFGIAKLLDASGRTDATISRPMTPEYASPEQVRGEMITTATDVYSLGVILYRLLTGHSPYRLQTRTPATLADAVTHDEPERPSAVQRNLRGDLDFILLKALRKEPGRRYVSVDQFDEDIRNYLEGLPVSARKGTWSYRAGKFVQRHKAGAVAALVVFSALVAGIVVPLREARIAEANRLRAERRFNDVHKLANSLMFEVHDSIRQLPGATAARKLIIERAEQYLDVLARESRSDPALLRDLAAAYGRLASVQGNSIDTNLGDTPRALQNYRKVVELLTTAVSLEPSSQEDLRQLALAYHNLSHALSETGDKGGSKATARKALEIVEPLAQASPSDRRIQFVLGSTYEENGARCADENDLEHAREFYEKALAVYEQLRAAEPSNRYYLSSLSFAHKHIGSVLALQQQLPLALDHYRAALAIDEQELSRDPGNSQARYNITYTYSDTGWILGQKGDFAGALEDYGKALQIRTGLAAADPNDIRARRGAAKTSSYIGGILRSKGDFDQAVEYLGKAVATYQALSERDPANEALRFDAAETLAQMGFAYTARALRARATAGEQLQSCRAAKVVIQKALPAYLQHEAQGRLIGAEVGMPETLERQLDQCSRIIARLTPPGDPSPQ